MGAVVLGGLNTQGAPAGHPGRQTGRLIAWSALVGLLAASAYAARLAGAEPPDDVLYLWSTVIGALIEYGVVFVLILAIAHGLDRALLALEVPAARGRAIGRALIALVVIVAATAALSPFLDAGGEQGLVPKSWDSSRAMPFLANAAVVCLVAPFVEELLYRGLGFGLLRQFVGAWPAIVVTGVAFGLAHGLVLGLPVLAIFGITLGWLRWQTGSVYPGMIVHCLFNTMALVAAVAR
jgi:membrane protease YdiL (CAAX protease family)